MPGLLREPDDPYDDQPEEPTPVGKVRRLEPCKVCWGTGRIHVMRDRRDVDRGRRCPVCRGTGVRIVESP